MSYYKDQMDRAIGDKNVENGKYIANVKFFGESDNSNYMSLTRESIPEIIERLQALQATLERNT